MKASLLTLVMFVALWCLAAAPASQIGALPSGNSNLRPTIDPKYRVGDVWEYATRSGEARSRFTVVKVEESSKLGLIIHIAVDELTWKSCQGGILSEQVPHMPFARKAVEHSAIRRAGHSHSLPNYQEGYEEWKNAFLNGRAGVYTISIRDAVSVAEKTWRTGMGCSQVPQ